MMQTPRPERGSSSRWFLAWALVFTFLWAGLGQVRATWGHDPARGELRIEGTHITKLILHGGDDPHTEELSDPCSSVSLPVGAYRLQRIELQGGYLCWAGDLLGSDPIVIMEDTPELLKVGGPLRQEITADCRGFALVLRYALLGIGSERYTPVTRDRPPRFAVLKGQKAVASGQFDYG